MAIQAQLYQENLGWSTFLGPQEFMEIQNACGFNSPLGFGLQNPKVQLYQPPQQQMQQFYVNQQLQNPSSSFQSAPNVLTIKEDHDNIKKSFLFPHSQFIAALIHQQDREIDQILRSQAERLRSVLEEQRKNQTVSLARRIESLAQTLMRQKDEEIARELQKSKELQGLLERLEMESETWQRKARESEAMVISLNNTLEQHRNRASCSFDKRAAEDQDDAESRCDGNREEDREETKSRAGGAEGYRRGRLGCKACDSGPSCMLFVPCMHLCSCKACEAFLDRCPLCSTAKEGIVEALL